MKRLNAQMGLAGWMSEQMGGLSYLEFMRNLSKRVDSEWDSVKADLHTIRAALLSRCVELGRGGVASFGKNLEDERACACPPFEPVLLSCKSCCLAWAHTRLPQQGRKGFFPLCTQPMTCVVISFEAAICFWTSYLWASLRSVPLNVIGFLTVKNDHILLIITPRARWLVSESTCFLWLVFVRRRTDTLVNLTGDAASLDKVSPAVDDFLSSLPEKPVAGAPWGASASGLLFPKKNEALTVPTQVCVLQKKTKSSRA
eukprot:scaffold169148_cov18-Tisochrysis_lutea.AAC.1